MVKDYFISTHEEKPFEIAGKVLSNEITEEWFGDEGITKAVCDHIGFSKESDNLDEYMAFYRRKIDEIINRVDRKNIMLSSLLIEKLQSYCLRVITPTN